VGWGYYAFSLFGGSEEVRKAPKRTIHVARHEISEKFFARCGDAQAKLNLEVTFASPSTKFLNNSNLRPRCFVPSLKFHSLLQIESPTYLEQQYRNAIFKRRSDG
jgi:hypothetical protein